MGQGNYQGMGNQMASPQYQTFNPAQSQQNYPQIQTGTSFTTLYIIDNSGNRPHSLKSDKSLFYYNGHQVTSLNRFFDAC